MVGNLITALTSNQMIAPSYWIDPKNGNDYMLTVQYPENQVKNAQRSASHSAARHRQPAADAAGCDQQHRARQRRPPKWITTSCAAPSTFMCGRWAKTWEASPTAIDAHHRATPRCQQGLTVTLRGMVQGMRASFTSFALGLVPGGGAALSDSGGAVPILRRSVPDSAGGAARALRA